MIIHLESRAVALRAEAADTRNWLDSFAAAPAEAAAACGLQTRDADGLVMTRSHIPFSHFNMVLTLGCPAAANDTAWGDIERFYEGGPHWVLANDLSEPSDLPQLLGSRGYSAVDRWDRAICHETRTESWTQLADGAVLVDHTTASQWSEFVVATYGMPPVIGGWLRALVSSPGWVHAIRREGDRPDGAVVMARSAFVDGDWAWLGVDAPIPGVMAPCHDDDLVVSAALLGECARRGATHFVTDIEATTDDSAGPGYDEWQRLGFHVGYRRTVFEHRSAE